MKNIEQFLLYCSGVDAGTLEQCPSDRNKYVGIGATIFFTGLLAFFSSGYALYTVFESYWAATAFGLVWGLMIFNLDRYIVMSMKSNGRWYRDLLVAAPRMALAVLLAVVISKPLELKIFEKEINAELVVMGQEVRRQQENKVQERFQAQIEEKKSQILTLKNELTAKTAARDSLVRQAVQEADGTGGSREKNLGPIYRAKKAEADQAQSELATLLAVNQPSIQEKERRIQELEQVVAGETAALEKGRYDGFAARIEAMNRLSQQSRAMYIAGLFIMFLFIAVETAPILVKLISYRSPYDYLLHQKEHVFEMAHLEAVTLRSTDVRQRLKYDTETIQYRTNARIAAEKALIDHHLREKLEALKKTPYDWKLGAFGSI